MWKRGSNTELNVSQNYAEQADDKITKKQDTKSNVSGKTDTEPLDNLGVSKSFIPMRDFHLWQSH